MYCDWRLPLFRRNWLNLVWVYLVSTEQITNRVSLEIIGIDYNSSKMDGDRYSGNCLFKVEADNGEEEEEQKNKILRPLYEIL